MQIPDAERTLIKSKVAIPFPHPRPPKDAQYKLQYDQPSNINVVGSYQLKTGTKTSGALIIDLLVTMPSGMFQDKDFMNYRYFYKRAFYLACIAVGIKQSKQHKFKVSFDTLNGNQLQPILVVEGTKDEGSVGLSSANCKIHILLGVPEGIFPADKTLPNRNCVRPKTDETTSKAASLPPTPLYNASLRMDGQMTAYLRLLHSTSAARCAGFKEACVLGRIWLRQRGLSGSIQKGGFGNFEWAVMMAILLESSSGAGASVLSPGYSSYQLFKATLQFLATRNLCKKPFTSQSTDAILSRKEDTPMFFDGARSLNILFKMSPWSYSLLQHEAQKSVKMLGDSVFDQFDATFVVREDNLLYRYDQIFVFPSEGLVQCRQGEDHEQAIDKLLRDLHKILLRGLGERVTLISIGIPSAKPWELATTRPVRSSSGDIVIGCVVDPVHIDRTIDRGPSAEDKTEAESFRRFWGDKAQLRRFNDGSIVESLEWIKKESGPSVFEQITTHLLATHFGKEISDKATFFGRQPAKLIRGNGIAAFKPIMDAFSKLSRDLRDLDGLPLIFRHILAASPSLAYSAVNAPLQNGPGSPSEPSDVVIEFEGSSRWPDELEAIQKTKIGFLLKISELLQESIDGVHARVGLENERKVQLNQGFLDVLYPSGAWFRLRIRLDREEAILDRVLKNKTLDTATKEIAAMSLAYYKRVMTRAPAHVQAFQTLSTRYPALSGAMRLARKWFSAHHLTPHVPDSVVDLLVARTFMQPYPWDSPSSPMTGFYRTLFFLSRWDWRRDPLIVDLSAGDMTTDEVAAIATRFEAWRKIDPAMNRVVLFAASNIDTDGTTWTDHTTPSKVIAGRMTALARAACLEIETQGLSLAAESLFVSSVTDYDFVLHINTPFTRAARDKRHSLVSDTDFKNLQIQHVAPSGKDTEFATNNPVALFYEDLKQTYRDCAIFFYDDLKSSTIAGLWNPTMSSTRNWRAKIGYSTVPVSLSVVSDTVDEDDAKLEVTLNKPAMLAEIARIGGDLIQKIEVLKH